MLTILNHKLLKQSNGMAFLLVEVIVQRVLGNLRFMTVFNHVVQGVQGVRVEDTLDQGMDSFAGMQI